MRVLLVNSPWSVFPEDLLSVVHPLGIAYIAAVLMESNYDVKILDAVAQDPVLKTVNGAKSHFGMDWRKIEREIRRYKPDVIGISCLFSAQSKNAHEVARIAKEVDDDIVNVMGGAHPSALPKQVLADKNIDFVVIGEGEMTVLELIEVLHTGNEFSNIAGIAYKNEERIIINNPRQLIQNLDEIPFPARHLLPMDKYFQAKAWHSAVIKHERFASVITSRGCPLGCNFCSIHTVWGRKWRHRDPIKVVDEIEYLVKEYNIKEIYFEDDNLTLEKKRAERICDEITERELDIYWTTPNGVKVDTLDKELLKKMRKSGYYRLHFGIEHGDPGFRKNVIKKPISTKQAKRVVQYCKELGIWTNGFFIIGFPQEDKKMIQKTIEFAKELDLDTASFFIASPYPGTKLYDECVYQGYIPENIDWNELRTGHPVIETENFTKENVEEWQKEAYRKFIKYRIRREINPLNFRKRLNFIRSFDDIKFVWRLLKGTSKSLVKTRI